MGLGNTQAVRKQNLKPAAEGRKEPVTLVAKSTPTPVAGSGLQSILRSKMGLHSAKTDLFY